MKVELLEPYIQISIEKESRFLKRAIDFAYKHFSKAYRLSSSVLILDDGERYKKDYFLNWAYHVAMQEENKKITQASKLSLIVATFQFALK